MCCRREMQDFNTQRRKRAGDLFPDARMCQLPRSLFIQTEADGLRIRTSYTRVKHKGLYGSSKVRKGEKYPCPFLRDGFRGTEPLVCF